MTERRGFTLIELLIVVAIIGILAAIAVPNFMNARTRAMVARVYGDIRAIGNALEVYALDNNEYPNFMPPGGPNDLGKFGLKKLSSPISYISSAILWDPFMPAGVETNHGPSYPPPYNYIYHDQKTTGGRNSNWWQNYDPEGKYQWYLCSVGPDQLFYHPDTSAPRWNWLISYHPSNGLVSLGNIYLYGPGYGTERDINFPR
jgi:prepilin-type N-terminal cleavage/methylation domain-containing protein